jgi:hypothetical protein
MSITGWYASAKFGFWRDLIGQAGGRAVLDEVIGDATQLSTFP